MTNTPNEFRTTGTPRTTTVFGKEDKNGIFWGIEFSPGKKDGSMSRRCHGWNASIAPNGRAASWPSTTAEEAEESEALLAEAEAVVVAQERFCNGTGWMNHYLASKLGLCELDSRCQPEVEIDELRRFLYLAGRLFDSPAFTVGPIYVADVHDVEGFHVGWNISAFGASTFLEA